MSYEAYGDQRIYKLVVLSRQNSCQAMAHEKCVPVICSHFFALCLASPPCRSSVTYCKPYTAYSSKAALLALSRAQLIGLDILERRHWAAILFLIGPSNAL